jgi:hypothetical protein
VSTTITQPWVYAPGQAITAVATAPVSGRRFVKPSGNRTAGGNLAVAHAASGDRALGVAVGDTPSGQLVTVVRGGVVRVTAGGAIAAGAAVQSSADGKAIPAAAGAVVGIAVTGVADGGIAEIAWQ